MDVTGLGRGSAEPLARSNGHEHGLRRSVAAQELDRAVAVDPALVEHSVQRIDRIDRRAVDSEDDVAFAQAGAGRRALRIDRDDTNAMPLTEAVTLTRSKVRITSSRARDPLTLRSTSPRTCGPAPGRPPSTGDRASQLSP